MIEITYIMGERALEFWPRLSPFVRSGCAYTVPPERWRNAIAENKAIALMVTILANNVNPAADPLPP